MISVILKRLNAILKATDFHPDNIVKVVEIDGTTMEFVSAFFAIYEEYIFVFSEHHDPYIQHQDEIEYVHQYKIIARFPGKSSKNGNKNKC